MYDATLGRFLQRDPLGYGGGDPDLYGYVRDDPAGAADPTGLIPPSFAVTMALAPPFVMPGSRLIGRNEYGWFYLWSRPVPENNPRALQAIPQFVPTKEAHCGELALIQVVRTIDLATGKSVQNYPHFDQAGWHVDNGPLEFDPRTNEVVRGYGWYGYAHATSWDVRTLSLALDSPEAQMAAGMTMALLLYSGVPRPNEVGPFHRGQSLMAWLGDQPSPNVAGRRQEFITCAVCRSGAQTGAIYGCITWGQEIDAQGTWKQLPTQFTSWPGQPFFSAVEAWNGAGGKWDLGPFPEPIGPPARLP
jgi:hypothetical protein